MRSGLGETLMSTRWVIVADASRARIFETRALGRGLREIEDLANPNGRAHSSDLLSDAGGRTYSNNGARAGKTQPRSDPVEHEVEVFAKRLADRIEQGRVERRFDALCFVAPPRFLGLLREKCCRETGKLVEFELAKDLSQLDAAAIDAHLRNDRP
jgi:protein required for attachment to host cells